METLIGKKFGRLLVLSFCKIERRNKIWNCICDCGKEQKATTYCLNKGVVKSCGCLRKERALAASTTHGKSKSALYKRWIAMKARCSGKDATYYTTNNINYCAEWELFENFHRDMLEGFSTALELDRINVNGNYCKENCRWVTHSENNYNKNKQTNNTSGKTGVSYVKASNKYRAYITVKRKQINLGLYTTLEEAVKVREQAEIKLWDYNRP